MSIKGLFILEETQRDTAGEGRAYSQTVRSKQPRVFQRRKINTQKHPLKKSGIDTRTSSMNTSRGEERMSGDFAISAKNTWRGGEAWVWRRKEKGGKAAPLSLKH